MVIRFGWRSTCHELGKLFAESGHGDAPIRLRGGEDDPVVADSGRSILDCHLERIADPDRPAPRFHEIPGVVEHGLFASIAREIVIGHADGGGGEVIVLPS